MSETHPPRPPPKKNHTSFPDGSVGKESNLQCRFNLWVGKIPWKRKMATCSCILAWEIPWTKEPGGLQSMWSQRVELDLACTQYIIDIKYLTSGLEKLI